MNYAPVFKDIEDRAQSLINQRGEADSEVLVLVQALARAMKETCLAVSPRKKNK